MTKFYSEDLANTTIGAIAVVPTLGSHSSTSAVSSPTPVSPGSQTKDILFALSYAEVVAINGGSESYTSVISGLNFFQRFWLRTANGSAQVWGVYRGAGGMDYGLIYGAPNVDDVGAIWVGTNIKKQVTVHYIDESGASIGTPSSAVYEVQFDDSFSLTPTQIPDISGYTYSGGWRTSPSGATTNGPVFLANVRSDSDVYLVYEEVLRDRYLVSKDTNPTVVLSMWHWLADAVDACGTDGAYTITATENDFDMSDTTGTDPYPTRIAAAYKDQAVVIPANKTITLTSEAGELYSIMQMSTNRHLEVYGSLAIKNVTLDGNSAGGGIQVGDLAKSSGTLIMAAGATIQNCYTSGAGGGVLVDDGAFTMAGGKIANNYAVGGAANGGGGVAINIGSFTMTGGLIDNNKCTNSGGGVWVSQNGTYAVSGGDITNNQSINGNGGGIFTVTYGNLTVGTAVRFSGNTAVVGYDTGHTLAEYIAAFQTALAPQGIYSTYGGTYSAHGTLTFLHPVNNYDINVIRYTITEKYVDTAGATVLDPALGTPLPNTTTFVFYGKTYSKPIPPIVGYDTMGYFIGATFNPPINIYTPGSSVPSQSVSGDMTVFFVYEKMCTLTISKKVTGIYAQKSRPWDFTLYLLDGFGVPLAGTFNYTIFGAGGATVRTGTISPDSADGSDVFELRHNQKIVIAGVPISAFVRIVEETDSNYDTSYIDSNFPTVKVDDYDTGGSNSTPSPVMLAMSAERQFDFTNEWIYVPEAGVSSEALLVFELTFLILTIAAGAFYFLVLRRRFGSR